MKREWLHLWMAFVIYAMATSAYSQSLFEAIGRGNIDSVKIIVAGDASTIHTPNTDGDLPLHIAAFRGHKDIAAYLLSQGADIAPSSNLEYFKAFQLQNAGIDIAFIDPFMIADSVGQVIIRQYIQPKQIILMHMRPDEVDRYEKESQAIFNNVIAFREQMEKKCFQR